jgi:hypothetical protein
MLLNVTIGIGKCAPLSNSDLSSSMRAFCPDILKIPSTSSAAHIDNGHREGYMLGTVEFEIQQFLVLLSSERVISSPRQCWRDH